MSPAASGSQPDLFGQDGVASDRQRRTRASMVWAAWGDALGFISELVDEAGPRRRTAGVPLDAPMPWTRRVGGRGGVNVPLPAGCWSDDTQLRMAVARAISSHGFDVDAFARIEMPVWPSYALGGGRASKAAASNLGRSDVLWFANTFSGWVDAGGNGAAMRVQPHVWASGPLAGYELDVIKDAVSTHGHPRAIVGACFHAFTVAHAMSTGAAPDVNQCMDFAADVGRLISVIDSEPNLGGTWRELWEKETGGDLAHAWRETVDEVSRGIEDARSALSSSKPLAERYHGLISELHLDTEKERGSGAMTPVAAVALGWLELDVESSLRIAANEVGSDTDTIATMAGAVLGATDAGSLPAVAPLDVGFLLAEADRLAAIASGVAIASYPYPDLLTWNAPAAQADALARSTKGEIEVRGLGPVLEIDDSVMIDAKGVFAWQWVRTVPGQTLLIKRREQLPDAPTGDVEVPLRSVRTRSTQKGRVRDTAPSATPDPTQGRLAQPHGIDRGLNIDTALQYALENIEDNEAVGYVVRRAARDGTVEQVIALMTALRGPLRR